LILCGGIVEREKKDLQTGKSTMLRPQDVLLLVSDGTEVSGLTERLESEGFVVHPTSLPEMHGRLETGAYSAVFCAYSSYHSDAEKALQKLRERYPHLPVIVLSSRDV
jgi:CheY-like chemotaxis protein